MTLHTDPDAQFECPEGALCGTAVYEITTERDGEQRCELVSFRIGGPLWPRYRVAEEVGEAAVEWWENHVLEQHASDPMGEAYDRARDRMQADWAAE